MTWADFWALTATLNGEATYANCQRLAEELYRLDQEKFGSLPVIDVTARDDNPFPQSSDVFLYARCAVVAAGQAVWESVLLDVDKFSPYTSTEYDGEWLLNVPEQAYELATGEEWTARPGTASRASPTGTAGRTCGTEASYRLMGTS
ncbi:DUF4240 domain-containing protein [Streptomyces sp. R-07]|uniref:DUF4240 domain-containing protein n=1 Tax=unclassified Streptomyces TaxID=2593676 RepID=UPI00342837CA